MHELLCAAKSAKIAMYPYLLVYYIIIKLQLLVIPCTHSRWISTVLVGRTRDQHNCAQTGPPPFHSCFTASSCMGTIPPSSPTSPAPTAGGFPQFLQVEHEIDGLRPNRPPAPPLSFHGFPLYGDHPSFFSHIPCTHSRQISAVPMGRTRERTDGACISPG